MLKIINVYGQLVGHFPASVSNLQPGNGLARKPGGDDNLLFTAVCGDHIKVSMIMIMIMIIMMTLIMTITMSIIMIIISAVCGNHIKVSMIMIIMLTKIT